MLSQNFKISNNFGELILIFYVISIKISIILSHSSNKKVEKENNEDYSFSNGQLKKRAF